MAQKQATTGMNNFEDDYMRLESTYSNVGLASVEYLTLLRNLSTLYTDTCYKQFYPRIAKVILDGSDATKHVYGADSEEFRILMINLNKTLLGKYFTESNYSSYSNGVISYLETLANAISNCSSKNKLEFATILSGLYQFYKPDYQKALEYGKLKYRLTKEMYDVDSDLYAYAISNLIGIYGNLNQIKESNKLISEYLETCSTSAVSRDNEIANLLNNLPTDTNSYIYETLLKEYALGFGDISQIMLSVLNHASIGNVGILSLIEKWVIPAQENPSSVFDYYKNVGVTLGNVGSNQQLAINYLNKALDYSTAHNLKELEFRQSGEIRNHLCFNIGVNYSRLNDNRNAAYSFLKSARNIQTYFTTDLKSVERCVSNAVYAYMQYYVTVDSKISIKDEVTHFLAMYSLVGNLKELYNLYCEFIYAEDDNALFGVEEFVISKEKDNAQIIDFYVGIAEQSQHDGLYQKAADANKMAIAYSEIMQHPEIAYWEYEGVKHSRWENIAYCLLQIEDFEGVVNAYINNAESIARTIGTESTEYKNSIDLLETISLDERMAPIIDRIFKESGY
jgi:hypothetical protein